MRKPSVLPSLTPLRGLAACWVLGYHVFAMELGSTLLLGRGDVAVDFFFMLSGFVLSHVYGADACLSSRFVGGFLWARFCRIWPLVGVMAVLLTVILPGATTLGFLTSVSLIQVPFSSAPLPLNGTEWSVSAEMWAYLLFPIIAPAILRSRSSQTSTWLIIAAYIMFSVLRERVSGGLVDGLPALIRALSEFVLGMYLYRAYAAGGGVAAALASDRAATVVCVGAVASLYSPPLMVAVAPAVILVGACSRGRAAAILNCGPLVWLGEISYAVYISQWLPLELGTTLPFARPARALMVMVGVFAFAAVLHYAVEIPARRWLRGAGMMIGPLTIPR